MLWSFVSSPQPTQGLWHRPGCRGKRWGPALWHRWYSWAGNPKNQQRTTCNDLQCSRKARKSSLNWNQEKIWRQSQKFFTCAQRQPLGGLEAAALSPELSFGLCLILKASKQGGCRCSLTASVWLEECLEWGRLSAPAMHDQSVISCNTQSLLFGPSHSNPGLDLANY